MSLVFPHGRAFYMLRHGETEDNKNKVVSGRASNTKLTEKGIHQAISMQPVIASIKPAIVYIVTSEMQRTIDTAKILCDCDALRHLEGFIDAGINERAYGEAEGMLDSERSKLKDAGVAIAGEESKEHLRVRTIRAIIHSLNHREGIGFFITHGGNVRRVLAEAKGEEFASEEKIANCGLYECITPKTQDGQWHVTKM